MYSFKNEIVNYWFWVLCEVFLKLFWEIGMFIFKCMYLLFFFNFGFIDIIIFFELVNMDDFFINYKEIIF